MFNCQLNEYLVNNSKFKDLANKQLFNGLSIPNSYFVKNFEIERNPLTVKTIDSPISQQLVDDLLDIVNLNYKVKKHNKTKKIKKFFDKIKIPKVTHSKKKS